MTPPTAPNFRKAECCGWCKHQVVCHEEEYPEDPYKQRYCNIHFTDKDDIYPTKLPVSATNRCDDFKWG